MRAQAIPIGKGSLSLVLLCGLAACERGDSSGDSPGDDGGGADVGEVVDTDAVDAEGASETSADADGAVDAEPDVVPDVESDALPDAAPDVETDISPDAEPDSSTDAADVADIAPTCLEPRAGAPDTPIETRAGAAPTLAGGTVLDGTYELTAVDAYCDGTFATRVTAHDMESNGNTFGSAVFAGPDWGIDLHLDIRLRVTTPDGNADEDQVIALRIAGPCTTDGNRLRADREACENDWPAGLHDDGSFEYEAGAGVVRIILLLTRDYWIGLFPPEYRDFAGLIISGDTPVVLEFRTD